MNTVEYITIYIAAAISLVALIVSLLAYFGQQLSSNQERVHNLTDKLYELDKLYIEHPELRVFLNNHLSQSTEYFIATTKHDEQYYRVWSFIDYHLTLFDEILSLMAGQNRVQRLFEYDSWRHYIISKMRHPLFREFYNRYKGNFGDHFADFIKQNQSEINSPATAD